MRKGILVVGMLFLLVATAFALEDALRDLPGKITPIYPSGKVLGNWYPRAASEGRKELVGHIDTIGTTYYDMQHNGNGTNIATDPNGGVHISWMNGEDEASTSRHVYYNYRSPEGVWEWPGTGMRVDSSPRAGYTTIAVNSAGIPLIGYHQTTPSGATHSVLAADIGPEYGTRGVFVATEMEAAMGDSGGGRSVDMEAIWPFVDVGIDDTIHMLSQAFAGSGALYYYRCHYADMGVTSEPPESVNVPYFVYGVNRAIACSHVSNKIAIVYTTHGEPDYGHHWPEYFNVYYHISTDGGETWGERVNATGYERYTLEETDTIFFEDTLGGIDTVVVVPRPWTDPAAIFDNDDNLHVVYTTITWSAEALDTSDTAGFSYYLYNHIYHWSEETGVTQVTPPGWYFTPGIRDEGGMRDAGLFHKPNLTLGDDGTLYCVWYQYGAFEDTLYEDYSGDGWEAGGIPNNEVYVAYSTDNGATWSEPLNLTDSHSPGCLPGECLSELDVSAAKYATNDSLYIFYILDKDAGVTILDVGEPTLNPVICHVVSTRTVIEGIEEEETAKPTSFTLYPNVPNPFNPATEIRFDVNSPSEIELAVYDILGKRVKTLATGFKRTGSYTVTWDGTDNSGNRCPSGLYFCKISSDTGGSVSRKMLLMK